MQIDGLEIRVSMNFGGRFSGEFHDERRARRRAGDRRRAGTVCHDLEIAARADEQARFAPPRLAEIVEAGISGFGSARRS